MQKSADNGLIKQAGILAGAGIIVRIIGLLYRSPLTGIIGDEGNGYYNAAYNCYAIILLISAYSIPSAVSKIMAARIAVHEYKNAMRIFYASLIYVLIVSGAFSAFVFFGAGIMTIGNSVRVLRVFAPTILLFGFLGVLRGYFQSMRTMIPTSISQIIEQIANAVISILAAWFFIRSAAPGADETERAVRGAIGSAMGTGAGVLFALVFMIFLYFARRANTVALIERDAHGTTESWKSIFLLLLLTVTPFILSTFIYNFSTMLDQTIFQRMTVGLKGFTEKEMAKAYGIFSTKAVVITNIPIALANAVSSAMMPGLAGYIATKEREKARSLVESALKITSLIAIPCAVGITVLSRPIVFLLFPQRASLDEASVLLAGMGITVIFYSISTVTNAVLQGSGHLNIPVINAAISLVIQATILAALLFFTGMGSRALVVAAIVYSCLMCILNHRSMKRIIGIKRDLRGRFVMPFISAAIMGVCSRLLWQLINIALTGAGLGEYISSMIALMFSIVTAMWIYALLLVRTGCISKTELLQIPKGSSVVNLLERLKILKR